MRIDIYCVNDSDVFTVTHLDQCGCGIEQPYCAEWQAAVTAGEFLPLLLAGDDYNTWRIVVDEALSEAEHAEWIGRLSHRLRVPEGQLVVAGGCEVIYEAVDGADDKAEAFGEYCTIVDVPPGEYRADIYTYIHSLNALPMLEAIVPPGSAAEALGTWFRRTRPDTEFPAWLAERCRLDPDEEDPGHAAEWEDAECPEDLPETSQAFVGYLLHLTRCDGQNLPECPPFQNGFFEFDAYTLRKPEQFPLGLAAQPCNLPEPVAPQPVHIMAYLENRQLQALDGGALAIGLAEITKLCHVAEICHAGAYPELRVRLPDTAAAFALPESTGSIFYSELDGNEFGVAFAEHRSCPNDWLSQVVAVLAKLPEASLLELGTADGQGNGADCDPAPGFLRIRGPVDGKGNWQITETYPPMSKPNLQAAMALAADLDPGLCLALHDDAEAAAVLDALCQDRDLAMMFEYCGNPIRIEGAQLLFEEPDPRLMQWLCQLAYWHRGYEAWLPMDSQEVDDDEDDDDWGDWGEPDEIMALVEHFDKMAVYDPTDKVPEGPPQGPFLYRDDASWLKFTYVHSDAGKLGKASTKLLQATDHGMAALGYTPCGDILCLAGDANAAMRGYARPGATQYGSLALSTRARGIFGWVSRFADGSYLSTTQQPQLRDAPERGLYFNCCPDSSISVAKMLHLHEQRAASLAQQHGPACPVEASALTLARWVDEFQNLKYRDTPLGNMLRANNPSQASDAP